jgi:hypothetical protein
MPTEVSRGRPTEDADASADSFLREAAAVSDPRTGETASPARLKEGEILADRFVIEGLAGRGGMLVARRRCRTASNTARQADAMRRPRQGAQPARAHAARCADRRHPPRSKQGLDEADGAKSARHGGRSFARCQLHPVFTAGRRRRSKPTASSAPRFRLTARTATHTRERFVKTVRTDASITSSSSANGTSDTCSRRSWGTASSSATTKASEARSSGQWHHLATTTRRSAPSDAGRASAERSTTIAGLPHDIRRRLSRHHGEANPR